MAARGDDKQDEDAAELKFPKGKQFVRVLDFEIREFECNLIGLSQWKSWF